MNIIFIEVEAALIPAPCLFIDPMASFKRIMSNTCCAILAKICEKGDVKIVCNSIHNFFPNDMNENDVRTDMVINGIHPEYFHPINWRTDFNIEKPEFTKEDAIERWLKHNKGQHVYSILDLMKYQRFPEASFVLDKNYGLDYTHFRRIMMLYGGQIV